MGGTLKDLWPFVASHVGEVVRDDPVDAGEVVTPVVVPEDSLCLGVWMPFSKQ